MLNVSKLIPAIVLVVTMSACGDDNRNETAKENTTVQQTSESTAAVSDVAPEFLIVKVPVNADGTELNDRFETKEFNGSDQFSSAQATETAFAQGTSVVVGNELDQDTSTEQWHGGRSSWYWNTPWYPGKLLGRGLWWGRNPYRYSYGYNYSYNHYQNYYSRGCNYYVYRRY